MKKLIVLLLLITIVCSMAACGECEHSWRKATCTSPKTCTLCGATEGSANGHKYKEATCTKPKTCSVCQETSGSPSSSNHNWKDATCTTPKTCSLCKKTSGEPLAHSYSNGYCTYCHEDAPKILTDRPEYLWFEMNSAGGIYFGWKQGYTGSKRINYITVEYTLYDAVGTKVKDDIHNAYLHSVRLIGPFNAGEPITFRSDVFVYCDICSKISFDSLTFEFADGTTATYRYGWQNSVD